LNAKNAKVFANAGPEGPALRPPAVRVKARICKNLRAAVPAAIILSCDVLIATQYENLKES
jgi:hypothetical protein